jgi:Bacterial nucleoid DNA-binding protein
MTKQPTLTKADLIEEVLKVAELPRKESETIVETIFESIIDALQKGDKIEIRGFGSFAPGSAAAAWEESEDGRKSGSAGEEDTVFQAQQGIEGFREHDGDGDRRSRAVKQEVELQERRRPERFGAFVFSDIRDQELVTHRAPVGWQGSEIGKQEACPAREAACDS